MNRFGRGCLVVAILASWSQPGVSERESGGMMGDIGAIEVSLDESASANVAKLATELDAPLAHRPLCKTLRVYCIEVDDPDEIAWLAKELERLVVSKRIVFVEDCAAGVRRDNGPFAPARPECD